MKNLITAISIIVFILGLSAKTTLAEAAGNGNQNRIHVTTANELIDAFQIAQAGDIIEIAEGSYNLENSMIPILHPDVTVEGAGPIRTKILGAIQASGGITIKKLSLEQRGEQYGTIRVVIAGPESSNVEIHDVWLKTSCSIPSCTGTTAAIVLSGQMGGINFQITNTAIVGDGQGYGVVIDEPFDVHRSNIKGVRFSSLLYGISFSVDRLLQTMDPNEYRRYLEKVKNGNFFDNVQFNIIETRG